MKKYIVGALVTTALVAGSITLSARKEESYSLDTRKRTNPQYIHEKRISWENPQEVLDKALATLEPRYISRVIYDPDFKNYEEYLRTKMPDTNSRNQIDIAVKMARSNTSTLIAVSGMIDEIGDGKKRPAFARKILLSSPDVITEGDLLSCLYHENIHAKEESEGYEIGDKRLNGKEVLRLFREGLIRKENIRQIGEFDAYAGQLERIIRGTRVSGQHTAMVIARLYEYQGVTEENQEAGRLTQHETEYLRRKRENRTAVIETLKRVK